MTGFQVRIIIPTLGDFANGFPAYDGLARQHGPFPMILPNAMRMFNGIKDFVSYQGFVSAVLFEDEVKDCSGILSVHELPAGMFKMKYGGRIEGFARPFVTCHVESFLKEHLKLDFDVSDSYSLKVKDVDVDSGDHIWAGDRWPETLDHRRAHSFMSHLPGLTFLDYKQSIFHNLNIIRKSEYPFVSTFTGVSILADLINKPNVVLWDEDMRNWQGWSPEFSYRRHYFADRNSYIEYIDDFRATELTNARTAERSLSSVKEGKASTIPTSIVTGQSASPGYKECRKDKPLTGDLAIISAADSQFFDLLQGMLRSLQDNAQSYNFTLYIFDLGLTETQRKWLLLQGASLHVPQDALWREGFPVYMHAFLSRSRIPELFPGHEVPVA
jgi:hypothetical protein